MAPTNGLHGRFAGRGHYRRINSAANEMQHELLTGESLGAAMQVHRVLGPGFLEKVYVNALSHELRKRGIAFQRKIWLRVYYDDRIVGEYEALFVESRVVVECKATCGLVEGNEAQVVNRLSAIRQDIGLLLNFGTDRLQFKRKTRTYVPTSRP